MKVSRMRVYTGFLVRFAEFCERFLCRRPCEGTSETAAAFGHRAEAFWGQDCFNAAGLLGLNGWKLGPLSRPCDSAYTFVALHAAAMIAFANFVTGNMKVWTQPALSGETKA